MEDIQQQIDKLKNEVKRLQDISIKIMIDPETDLILKNLTINSIRNIETITNAVSDAIVLLPTITYSISSPSGTPPTGSLWFKDTGTLVTREIHQYSGTAWVQFK